VLLCEALPELYERVCEIGKAVSFQPVIHIRPQPDDTLRWTIGDGRLRAGRVALWFADLTASAGLFLEL